MNPTLDRAKVDTVEKARALPEVDNEFYDVKRTIDQKTGVTTVERTVRPFCPRGIDGDEIILFIDSDGRAMKVIGTPNGPAKTEFR